MEATGPKKADETSTPARKKPATYKQYSEQDLEDAVRIGLSAPAIFTAYRISQDYKSRDIHLPAATIKRHINKALQSTPPPEPKKRGPKPYLTEEEAKDLASFFRDLHSLGKTPTTVECKSIATDYIEKLGRSVRSKTGQVTSPWLKDFMADQVGLQKATIEAVVCSCQ